MLQETVPGATYGEFHPNGVGATSLYVPELHFRAASDGRTVGQGHDTGHAIYRRPGQAPIDLGETAGTSIAAFHPTNGDVYVSTGAGVKVFTADGVFSHLLPGYIGSQGIRWVNADGSIVSGDATYGLAGRLGQYSQVGDVYLGQGLSGGLDCIMNDVRRTVVPGVTVEFLRVNRVGSTIVAYWTDFHNGFKLSVTADELAALPSDVTPIPPPVTPKPEPKPTMPVQNRNAELTAFWQQWNGRQPITDDAEKHKFTEALAGHLNALDGDGRWGRKARAGTDAKSKDTLGYWLGASRPSAPTDGKVDAFDVVASSGVVSWDLRAEQNDPAYHNIDARWFPVAATSGPVSQPSPVGTSPSPASSGPGAALDAELKALLTRLVAAENRIAELAARPQPTPQPAANLNGVRLALRTSDGHYLCAEGGGGGEVNATRTGVGGWETYTVELQ